MGAKRGLKDFMEEWRRERPDVYLTAFSIAGAIKQIDLQTEAEFRRLSADFGIGPGDLRVLFALRRSGVANPRRPTDLFQSLLVTSGAVRSEFRRLSADFGIGPGDLRVLFALRRSGVANPRRPTDLFQSLLVTSGAV